MWQSPEAQHVTVAPRRGRCAGVRPGAEFALGCRCSSCGPSAERSCWLHRRELDDFARRRYSSTTGRFHTVEPRAHLRPCERSVAKVEGTAVRLHVAQSSNPVSRWCRAFGIQHDAHSPGDLQVLPQRRRGECQNVPDGTDGRLVDRATGSPTTGPRGRLWSGRGRWVVREVARALGGLWDVWAEGRHLHAETTAARSRVWAAKRFVAPLVPTHDEDSNGRFAGLVIGVFCPSRDVGQTNRAENCSSRGSSRHPGCSVRLARRRPFPRSGQQRRRAPRVDDALSFVVCSGHGRVVVQSSLQEDVVPARSVKARHLDRSYLPATRHQSAASGLLIARMPPIAGMPCRRSIDTSPTGSSQ